MVTKGLFFIQFFQQHPLIPVMELLAEYGSLPKKHDAITQLSMKEHYQLIGLAKLGVLSFRDDQIFWNFN